ncbi:hypothetical protein EPA93_48130 [Ktedonosporobacter rubrisoli]|uniref:Uncharacterized protein n=1 Tax=Ktedonosporobacter rubrisoli TaxID=2509675 RepID=A0A4P6JHI5_KTERU|nr:hypothetical protein [Ktedonosporobacter rubrisoli]QBD74475.1 hypothetical protein EPA93_00080 [Ktedonosporobacter rubrisoli]QBD83323.1 hypothetical protein EPA93_48130 [Ktedonosporobacter rubrisoli]
MPTEDEMTVTERRKYLKKMKPLYAKAERSEQSRMLTEMEQVTGLHRKSLLRLLHAPTRERKKRVKGRGRTYGLAVEQAMEACFRQILNRLPFAVKELPLIMAQNSSIPISCVSGARPSLVSN